MQWGYVNASPLDSDLSVGLRHSAFEQPGPGLQHYIASFGGNVTEMSNVGLEDENEC